MNPARYNVMTIGDAYNFGAISGAGPNYVVTTARDPLRVHTGPATAAPTKGLLARGSTVESTGNNEIAADGGYWIEVLHPTLGTGWSDGRYLADATQPAAIAQSQSANAAAQAAADAKNPGVVNVSIPPSKAASSPWMLIGIAAAVGAIWYVSRDKRGV